MIPGHNSRARNARPGLAALCCALLLALATSAIAQKPQAPFAITLDPATTSVHWTLNTTIHTVHGTFKLKSGSMLVDPETGEHVEVDSSRRIVRERFAALERERRETVARELRRLRVAHVTLSTGDEWLLELGRALR